MRRPIKIRANLRRETDASYDVEIGEGLLETLPKRLARGRFGRRLAVVCDAATAALFGERFVARLLELKTPCVLLVVAPGEQSKSLAVFEQLCRELRRADFDRGDCVLALGGGVVGDLAGFVAGCYMRGLAFIQAPTTLLAQVDAAVGGKTAVNLDGWKNNLGLFYQPKLVVADVAALESLPEAEIRAGLAEVLKYAFIADQALCAFLEENAEAFLARERKVLIRTVAACCAVKVRVVEEDEREAGTRRILNYGHTLGHALEQALAPNLSHGLAVAYGMRMAAALALEMGILSEADHARHEALLTRYGLALEPLAADPAELARLAAGDKKKRGDRLPFVLLTEIGKTVIRDDVPAKAVRKAVERGLRGK